MVYHLCIKERFFNQKTCTLGKKTVPLQRILNLEINIKHFKTYNYVRN